ncbi:hypothetical protein C8J56DRAFT_985829 [Mycena floridula]|nr:hypothetical protein C8J56DRAFT_985829 [Mycena floridula]
MLSHSSFLLSSTFPMGSPSLKLLIPSTSVKSPIGSMPFRWPWISALGTLFFLFSRAKALSISCPDIMIDEPEICTWKTNNSDTSPDHFALWWGTQSVSVESNGKDNGKQPIGVFNVAGPQTVYAKTESDGSESPILAQTTFTVKDTSPGKPPGSNSETHLSYMPRPSTTSITEEASTSSTDSDASVPSSVVLTSETLTFATTAASSSADSNSPMTFPATSSSAAASIGVPAMSTSTSTGSANPPSSESGISQHHSNTAQIVGAVVGALIGISLIIIGLILLRRYRRTREPVPIFDRERMVRGPNSYSSVLVPVIEPNSYTPEPNSIPKRNTYATLLDALERHKPEEPYPPEDYAGLPEIGYSTTDPAQLSPLREKYGSDE